MKKCWPENVITGSAEEIYRFLSHYNIEKLQELEIYLKALFIILLNAGKIQK